MGFFPEGFTPRDVQVDALKRIADALARDDVDYVILEGPPGVGKSLIGMTMARMYGSAYICTLTKQLQAQLMRDFTSFGLRELKGRGAFQCAAARDTCAVGAVLYKGKHACHKCGTCPYYDAKVDAFRAPFTIANYHSFLANVHMADLYHEEEGENDDEGLVDGADSRVRPLLILDEAHSIEGFLLDVCGLSITLSKLPLITPPLPKKSAPVGEYFSWLSELSELLLDKAKTTPDPMEKDDIEKLLRQIGFVRYHEKSEAWIAEPMGMDRDDASDVNNTGFVLKPLTVKAFGQRILRWGKKVLLMSATVLDPHTVASSLGLDPNRGEFIQLPCIFPKENRPVYVSTLDMSYKAREYSWPLMHRAVENILRHHKDEKGLILAPSNLMLTEIRKNLPKDLAARLILAFGDDREAKYNEHVKGKAATVLCASGYWEGADLAGDASRFQIIPAIPRAHWSGQVKARGASDPTWYRWLAMCKLIQGLGRSVRNENDSAVSYVLDKEFRAELARAHGCLIPPWLAEAVVLIDT